MNIFNEELKPCPKCNGTNIKTNTIIGATLKGDQYNYYCAECGYKTKVRPTLKGADESWQKRTEK